jgi:Insect cuticle protein
MISKVLVLFCVIVIVAGYSYIPPAVPSTYIPPPETLPEESGANYEFSYEVNEQSTGDVKQHNEKAVNGKVTGQYSLLEPDGKRRRVVEYTADDVNGFQANVRYEEVEGAQNW